MTFSLFGNKKPLAPKPRWEDFAGDDQILQSDEQAKWQQAISDWEQVRGQREERDNIYKQMAQKTGYLAPAFSTSMGTREAPPNMMTSLFPQKMAPVDILSPEIASIDDLYRKRPNIFRNS